MRLYDQYESRCFPCHCLFVLIFVYCSVHLSHHKEVIYFIDSDRLFTRARDIKQSENGWIKTNPLFNTSVHSVIILPMILLKTLALNSNSTSDNCLSSYSRMPVFFFFFNCQSLCCAKLHFSKSLLVCKC